MNFFQKLDFFLSYGRWPRFPKTVPVIGKGPRYETLNYCDRCKRAKVTTHRPCFAVACDCECSSVRRTGDVQG